MIICDFCDKEQHEAYKMIMGNRGAAICDACAIVAIEIVLDERAKDEKLKESSNDD